MSTQPQVGRIEEMDGSPVAPRTKWKEVAQRNAEAFQARVHELILENSELQARLDRAQQDAAPLLSAVRALVEAAKEATRTIQSPTDLHEIQDAIAATEALLPATEAS